MYYNNINYLILIYLTLNSFSQYLNSFNYMEIFNKMCLLMINKNYYLMDLFIMNNNL